MATQLPEVSDTEIFSENLLGPVSFKLSALKVKGKGPGASDIIAYDEELEVSVKVTFNQTPLSTLLMCLGTDVAITFDFEGFGPAKDTNTSVPITTRPNQFEYTVTYTGTPRKLGLDKGYYELAATSTIGPVTHECGEHVLGYGYIGEFRFQVY
jgi:hypothetical protein